MPRRSVSTCGNQQEGMSAHVRPAQGLGLSGQVMLGNVVCITPAECDSDQGGLCSGLFQLPDDGVRA